MPDDGRTYRLSRAELERLPRTPGKPADLRSEPPRSGEVIVRVGRARWTIPLAVISSCLTLAGTLVYNMVHPPALPTDATQQIRELDAKVGRYRDSTDEQIDALRRELSVHWNAEHNREVDVAYQLREIDRRMTDVERLERR